MQYHKTHLRLFGHVSPETLPTSITGTVTTPLTGSSPIDRLPRQWEISRIGEGWEEVSKDTGSVSSSGGDSAAEEAERVNQEIEALEKQLEQVEGWKKVRDDLRGLMCFDIVSSADRLLCSV